MSNACEICDYHNKQYACCERNGIGYVEENCQFYRWFEKGKAAAIEPIKEIIADSEKMMWHSSKTLENIKEKLKEQKNE